MGKSACYLAQAALISSTACGGLLQVLAEDLLNTVRKTESTLKRLKKVAQADGAGGCATNGQQNTSQHRGDCTQADGVELCGVAAVHHWARDVRRLPVLLLCQCSAALLYRWRGALRLGQDHAAVVSGRPGVRAAGV